jgi:metal transporter CNNM
MHSTHATHGGDLKTDTVTIIGATLDLQEKVVKQVCAFLVMAGL